jgi:hypothetical protein
VDPDPGLFFTPGSGIRDGEKNQDPGPGINIPDNFSESLETVFRVKILKVFNDDPDPGSGIFFTLDPGSRMEKFGSRINIDSQH